MKLSFYCLLATLILSPLNGSDTPPGLCVVSTDGACIVEADETSHEKTDAAGADSFGVEQELVDAALKQHYEKSKIYMAEAVYRNESLISVREKVRVAR